MSNWLKKLFCGGKCKCHCEGKDGEKKECCKNTPKVDATAEVKPNTDSSTPEVKM
jgi:hypothetical protein